MGYQTQAWLHIGNPLVERKHCEAIADKLSS